MQTLTKQQIYNRSEAGRARRRRYQQTEKFKEAQRARNRARRDRVRSELRAHVDAFKMARGCADCGYNAHPRALDLDHVGDDKVASIADLCHRMRPWEEIKAELAKCEVVCANCHRVRTWFRQLKGDRAAATDT